ncbi:hypothetical protein ACJ72_06917 [Emergomyces africanus]|uniref:Inositol hexakisphosphate and diphosphoinositol-pentakisphosphate kinase n=1 Tax=Emergomyces africanus TaxID=1955775 RepID=A0A1B7NPR2_9EURO|nr:hypothetical protein ACJ72_06917 [Emergomyces africanus]
MAADRTDSVPAAHPAERNIDTDKAGKDRSNSHQPPTDDTDTDTTISTSPALAANTRLAVASPSSSAFAPPPKSAAAVVAAAVAPDQLQLQGNIAAEQNMAAGDMAPPATLPPTSAAATTSTPSIASRPSQTFVPDRDPHRDSHRDSHRVSFSSLYSLGSTIYSATGDRIPSTGTSSVAGSIKSSMDDTAARNFSGGSLGGPSNNNNLESPFLPSTATPPPPLTADSTSPPTAMSSPGPGAVVSPPHATSPIPRNDAGTDGRPTTNWVSRPARSSSRTPRRFSGSTAASSASEADPKVPLIGRIGVCALDIKARSKPSQNILTRLQSKGDFEVIVFGDKVILDEDVENWPVCDFLIAFFSDGFPLDKAIAYAKLRKPFCINDLPMQKVLWDRRLCLRILDQMGVRTPKRLEVNRDGGPRLESQKLAEHIYELTGVKLEGPDDGTGGGTPKTQSVSMSEDGESLIVDGKVFRKPFVEKPVSGEDHNIHIYFPNDQQYGGGGRRLFRKIGNKSSEYDPDLTIPRSVLEKDGSYLYEQFLRVDNAEDVKAYTVGPDFCHAETRKSPVVDGLVRRNTHGKELRYITKLSKEEATMASKISNGFGQRICGFDMLRVGDKSYVIDVNGWSFVKDNNDYYDKCAKILREMFINQKLRRDGKVEHLDAPPIEMAPLRKSNGGSHRQALKSLLKSPSMTRMQGPHYSQKTHPIVSADLTPATTSFPTPASDSSVFASQPKGFPTKTERRSTLISTDGTASSTPCPTGTIVAPLPASKHSWKLKGMVAVIRHADRTPKQKFKFTFHTQPFIDLLKGHQEEVVIKGEAALRSVSDAVRIAMEEGIEDMEKLKLLQTSLYHKGGWPGTKVQIKPMFRHRRPDEMRDRVFSDEPLPPIAEKRENVAPDIESLLAAWI